eukprot:CAMPEP_0195151696 /NCGR_PEP_ID=MMETSP0448-20130528/181035_1 /TAXON_ID=66468 /ORGANISM="Heterocapsa triquestra, Strain CCMP 448" /LENGTH=70 /DNA_ID=CAMNT_0040190411 /DNA_START=1024 /DNA_END=1236 /DNA_ORIENTATION=+
MNVTSSGGLFEAARASAPSIVLGPMPLIFDRLSTHKAVGAVAMASNLLRTEALGAWAAVAITSALNLGFT